MAQCLGNVYGHQDAETDGQTKANLYAPSPTLSYVVGGGIMI